MTPTARGVQFGRPSFFVPIRAPNHATLETNVYHAQGAPAVGLGKHPDLGPIAADFEHEDRLIDAFDRLLDLLTDPIVDRHTEQAVFHDGLLTACQKSLTPAQKEAKLLEAEAVALGRNPARYVAQYRGISVSAAYALLKRADDRKMLKNPFSMDGNSDDISKWIPPREIIDLILINMKVQCAAGGQNCKGYAKARFAICWNCRLEFGAPYEWDDITRRWLAPEVRRLRREAYGAAVNKAYALKRTYKMVDSPEEYAALTEAV